MSVLTTLLALEVVVGLPVSVADVRSDVLVGVGALSVEVVEVVLVDVSVVEVVDVVDVLVVDVVLSELVVEVVDSDEVVEVVDESVAVGAGIPEVMPAMSVTPWLWPAETATSARE